MVVGCGEVALTRVPRSERYRKSRLFVTTLDCSCSSFRHLVWNACQQVWPELHPQTFRRFGGRPRYVMQDNHKGGAS